MKTITDQTEILALLPDFTQTILENGSDGETVEHGFLNQGEENETPARVIYALPADGKRDQETGEFIGEWNAHIVRMEIDRETP
jgi:DNA-binding HxlR family transcriptional regulator